MRVRDLMTPTSTTVRPTDSIAAALSVLESLHVHHVPIVDERGALLGVVGDGDLRCIVGFERAEAEMGERLDCRVSRAMNGVVRITLREDDDASEAMEKMRAHHVGALPVVDVDGDLVGVVTFEDLLH